MTTNYLEFVKEKFKTPEATLADIQKISENDAAFIHAGMGIFGEVAELVTAVTRENQKEELGDSVFFLIAALHTRGYIPKVNAKYLAANVHPSADGPKSMRRLFRNSTDLFDLCKKRLVYAKEFPTDLTISLLLSDIANNLYRTCVFLGFDWDDVVQDNINKLTKRYSKGFSNTEAQQRADKPSGE